MTELYRGIELKEQGNGFTYLTPEHAAFCRSFGVNEEQFLNHPKVGGVKGYTWARLRLADARRLGDVPLLPASEEEALQHWTLGSTADPLALAVELWSEQQKVAGGLLDAAKADKRLKETQARDKQDEDIRLRNEALYMAKTRPDWPAGAGGKALGETFEQYAERKAAAELAQEALIQQALKEVKSRRHAI